MGALGFSRSYFDVKTAEKRFPKWTERPVSPTRRDALNADDLLFLNGGEKRASRLGEEFVESPEEILDRMSAIAPFPRVIVPERRRDSAKRYAAQPPLPKDAEGLKSTKLDGIIPVAKSKPQ